MTKRQSLPKAEPPGGLKSATGSAAPMTSREMRRALQRGPSARPGNGRGNKVGGSARLAEWKAAAAVRKHLEAMKTGWLADQIRQSDPKVSATLTKLASTFPTVWGLTQAPRAELLAVFGVGSAGIDRLKTYLDKHSVAVRWDEPRGN